METWDAIRARRNVRSYTSQPIGQADLDRILEAGRRAPSARNTQPWDFVVTGRAELTELARVWQAAGHVAQSAATIGLARRLLGFPADRFLAYLIALGYPADRPLAPLARPGRRPFQDVVHWGRW